MAQTRVLIIGAGLAGLALAQALHRANLEVFESDDSASTRGQGYRLTIDPQQGARR